MGKIRNFCRRNGISLKTPRGWAQLFRRTAQFIKKNKGHVFRSVCLKLGGGVLSGEQMQEKERTYPNVRADCVPKQRELAALACAAQSFRHRYSFSVVVMVTEGSGALDDLIADVGKQIFPAKEICLCGAFARAGADGEKSGSMAEYPLFPDVRAAYGSLTADYVVTVREGDRLEREALFEMAYELDRAAEPLPAVYCDHDRIGKEGYEDPYFKPGFSPDLLLACDYVCGAYAVRRDRLAAARQDASLPYRVFLYDLFLQCTADGSCAHAAGPLFHLAEDEKRSDEQEAYAAVRARILEMRGGESVLRKNIYGNVSVERSVRGEPLVSVIILTAFKGDYAAKCVASIKAVSAYKNYEIVLVDTSRKKEPQGGKGFAGVKMIRTDEPFNWSRLNNLAAREAKGDFLIFLNDDTEVVTPDWMERMVSEAQRPEIGEVGALLLFPDGTVQHAGAFLSDNGGGAKHYYYRETEKCREYHDFLHYRRECTFCTGACIAIERKKFEKVGGFDENFVLVSNDLEFGLRLREAGYRNLYLPDVKLTHKEKATRREGGESEGEAYAARMLGGKMSAGDEYFNVYLDRYLDVPTPDPYPVRAMLTGSPTFSRALVRRILLVKLDHIGDNVIALPAVRKIRALFPDARLDILCAPWLKNFWSAQPEIDNVFTYEYFTERSQNGVSADEERLKTLLSELKKQRYDLSVHLRRHEETKFIAEQAADYCLAYSGNADYDEIAFPVPAFTDKFLRDPKWSMRDQLVSLAGWLDGEPSLDAPIQVPPETREKMRAYAAGIPQFSAPVVVGIHAGAGGDFRQWGARKFARLCNILFEKTDACVVLFGGKNEEPINKEIMEQVRDPSRIVSVAGHGSLLDFCELVRYVDYFVGNNSGPKHIAGIQGVPTLSIDGISDEQEWSAPGAVHMTVRKVMNCCPCPYFLKEQCAKNGICLALLDAGDVWRGLERLMLLYPKKTEEKNG